MMKGWKHGAAAAAIFLLAALPALAAASFDCAKATHEIEKLICTEEPLAALDRQMAMTFKAAENMLKDVVDRKPAMAKLHDSQRKWTAMRDRCAKANDKTACVEDRYETRIAELTALYMLEKAEPSTIFICNGRASDELAATFYKSVRPSVRLERGDSVEVGVLQPSGSGSHYVSPSGVEFWTQGDDAQVEWPKGTAFKCTTRK